MVNQLSEVTVPTWGGVCVCMSVYMSYVGIYACICIMCEYVYVCMQVYVYVCIYVCMCMYVHICICVYVCVRVLLWVEPKDLDITVPLSDSPALPKGLTIHLQRTFDSVLCDWTKAFVLVSIGNSPGSLKHCLLDTSTFFFFLTLLLSKKKLDLSDEGRDTKSSELDSVVVENELHGVKNR